MALHGAAAIPTRITAPSCSALSAAVLSGSLELVQVLVSHGACRPRNGGQFIGRDHAALRAVALAAQRGRVDLLEALYPPLAKALQGEEGVACVVNGDEAVCKGVGTQTRLQQSRRCWLRALIALCVTIASVLVVRAPPPPWQAAAQPWWAPPAAAPLCTP